VKTIKKEGVPVKVECNLGLVSEEEGRSTCESRVQSESTMSEEEGRSTCGRLRVSPCPSSSPSTP